MVALTFTKLFAPAQLPAAAGTIYTCPATPAAYVVNGRIRFTNTDGAAHQVTAYLVPSGGSAGVGNAFLVSYTIGANAFLDIDLPQMGPGDFLQAFADVANKVTIHSIAGVVSQ